ncbi:hypothetical protein CKO50_15735 [Pseudoalteromonas sp. HM-SA03]|uniref:hypothetical protein n=1 Tax=Pseudoalteromonas sp. HM-SA03 TaxID=2029678 RepID=UPI000BADEE17|nr:hypothetical protein [Pseudoalteromonas sp. HM-SA03]PAY00419.1 hypothetical protein CKO50_15735 [Pseudoalteromonas sp. HM-SA03]
MNDDYFYYSYYLKMLKQSPDCGEFFLEWSINYLGKKSKATAKAVEEYRRIGSSPHDNSFNKINKFFSKPDNRYSFLNSWRQAKRREFSKKRVTLDLDRLDYIQLKQQAIKHNRSMTEYLILLLRKEREDFL